jgi:hypothetical protein
MTFSGCFWLRFNGKGHTLLCPVLVKVAKRSVREDYLKVLNLIAAPASYEIVIK